jgi:hypothetical protein
MSCDLHYQVPEIYSVVIHNLARYNAHLCIKKLAGNINCIPNTDESTFRSAEMCSWDINEIKLVRNVLSRGG